ncbi:MAG: hypothetical protein RLZZ464_537 [Pseudomonadota bacterium]
MRNLLRTRISRIYFSVMALSFIFGFFFKSGTYEDIYYKQLVVKDAAIKEINSNKCIDLNEIILSQALINIDLENYYQLIQKRPECKNLVDLISSNEIGSIPATEYSIEKEFQNKYQLFIMKNNARTGLEFLTIAFLFIVILKISKNIFQWISNGEKK